MNKPLITNSIIVSQKKETVLNFLGDVKNSLKWDSDIATLEAVDGKTEITRKYRSLNDKEIINVEKSADFVTYHCKGNRLNYEVRFDVDEETDVSRITETVFLDDNSDTLLPLKFIKPITKRAFANKLDRLAVILE